jgi:hypothetical protein
MFGNIKLWLQYARIKYFSDSDLYVRHAFCYQLHDSSRRDYLQYHFDLEYHQSTRRFGCDYSDEYHGWHPGQQQLRNISYFRKFYKDFLSLQQW